MSRRFRNRILVGDVRQRLGDIASSSVDCVITSPPYFQLRNYGRSEQIGLEPAVGEWVASLRAVLSGVRRVLKPEGVFLMTTPNGDFLKIPNRDHKRHYRRHHLRDLLARFFDDVEVEYAVCGGRYRSWGLMGWSVSRPHRTALSMFGNVVNTIQSRGQAIKQEPNGTHNLIAMARKKASSDLRGETNNAELRFSRKAS